MQQLTPSKLFKTLGSPNPASATSLVRQVNIQLQYLSIPGIPCDTPQGACSLVLRAIQLLKQREHQATSRLHSLLQTQQQLRSERDKLCDDIQRNKRVQMDLKRTQEELENKVFNLVKANSDFKAKAAQQQEELRQEINALRSKEKTMLTELKKKDKDHELTRNQLAKIMNKNTTFRNDFELQKLVPGKEINLPEIRRNQQQCIEFMQNLRKSREFMFNSEKSLCVTYETSLENLIKQLHKVQLPELNINWVKAQQVRMHTAHVQNTLRVLTQQVSQLIEYLRNPNFTERLNRCSANKLDIDIFHNYKELAQSQDELIRSLFEFSGKQQVRQPVLSSLLEEEHSVSRIMARKQSKENKLQRITAFVQANAKHAQTQAAMLEELKLKLQRDRDRVTAQNMEYKGALEAYQNLMTESTTDLSTVKRHEKMESE